MKDSTQIRFESYDWDQPFDPAEFRGNPKAITMLYEQWLQATSDLHHSRGEVGKLKQQVVELDKSKALLTQERNSLQKRKWPPFVLQLVSVFCGGFGVNLLSGQPVNNSGWGFIMVAAVLEFIAFFALKSED